MPSEVNPFAAPSSSARATEPATIAPDDTGTYWDDECLIVPKNAALAGYCVKCNAPTEYLVRRRLSWHRAIYYWWIPIGLFIYFLVAMVKTRKGYVYIAVCPIHRRQRRLYLLLAWMAPVAWLTLMGLAGLMGTISETWSLWEW